MYTIGMRDPTPTKGRGQRVGDGDIDHEGRGGTATRGVNGDDLEAVGNAADGGGLLVGVAHLAHDVHAELGLLRGADAGEVCIGVGV